MQPSLIVSDIAMTSQDGFDFLIDLRGDPLPATIPSELTGNLIVDVNPQSHRPALRARTRDRSLLVWQVVSQRTAGYPRTWTCVG